MSKIVYPGHRSIEGPWLVDKDGLSSFEKMVSEVAHEQTEETGEQFRPQYKVEFTDKQVAVSDSLLDIVQNNDFRKKVPKLLTARVISDRQNYSCTEFQFWLTERSIQSFEYTIRDVAGEEFKHRCINKVENWIEDTQPSVFLRLWQSISGYLVAICAIVVLFSVAVFSSDLTTPALYQDSLSGTIEDLLEEGINENNYLVAIELILIREFSYVPESFSISSNYSPTLNAYLWVFGIAIGCIILALSYPTANIAIGAGKARVKRWRGYVWFVCIFVPSSILLPILLEIISRFI